jgi:hypothetical protein
MKTLPFAVCLLLSGLIAAGCQKKEHKNAPRCVYDQRVFAREALNAATSEEQFVTFKKNPFLNLLWENHSLEEGEQWLQTIEHHYPFLKEKFEKISESDQVGSPRVYPFKDAGRFSPSTLRFTAIAGEIQTKLGGWQGKKVVQIGAGFGGLCKVLHAIAEFESYTLVDLPEQLALAKKYLEAFGLKNVIYSTPEELVSSTRYDLVLSDRSFSEFNGRYQKLFFDRIISTSDSGFLLGWVFPKHYGVIPWNFTKLKRVFEKLGKFAHWEIQEPTLESENYLISFTRKLNDE